MAKAVNIKWETDGHDIDLPDEVELPQYVAGIDEDYDVADYLSDNFGWLVKSFNIEDQ